jgi:hypothetical protein
MFAAAAAPAFVRAESLMKIVVPEKKILVPNQDLVHGFAMWAYEPGQFSGHDWYMDPGGPRINRAQIPAIAAQYFAKL